MLLYDLPTYTMNFKFGENGRKNYTFGPLINAVFAITNILPVPSCEAATPTFY